MKVHRMDDGSGAAEHRRAQQSGVGVYNIIFIIYKNVATVNSEFLTHPMFDFSSCSLC